THVESGAARDLPTAFERHVSFAAAFLPAFFTLPPLHLLAVAADATPLPATIMASTPMAAANLLIFLSPSLLGAICCLVGIRARKSHEHLPDCPVPQPARAYALPEV